MSKTPAPQKAKLDLTKLRNKLKGRFLADFPEIQRLSTGIPRLDLMTGGGIPCGMITEIYGWYSSAKTLIGLHMIAELQKVGGLALFIDTECSLNQDFASAIGVDTSQLIVLNPDNMEEVYGAMKEFILQTKDLNIPKLIFWDSLAATAANNEDAEKVQVAPEARILSRIMQKIPKMLKEHNVAWVIINQLRNKIGVIYGPSEDTKGGNAVRYHGALRIEMTKGAQILEGKKVIGQEGKLKITKSKICKPNQKMSFQILWDVGIVSDSGIYDALEDAKLIEKRGGWNYYTDDEGIEHKFRRKECDEWVKDYPELLARLGGGAS